MIRWNIVVEFEDGTSHKHLKTNCSRERGILDSIEFTEKIYPEKKINLVTSIQL